MLWGLCLLDLWVSGCAVGSLFSEFGISRVVYVWCGFCAWFDGFVVLFGLCLCFLRTFVGLLLGLWFVWGCFVLLVVLYGWWLLLVF